MSDGVGLHILCPETSCGSLIDCNTVIKLTKHNVQDAYSRIVSDNFVASNSLMKWCPAPDCSYAIKVVSAEAKPTLCDCGHLFCFSCCENWHAPVNCKLLKKWKKKCQDDSETANWLT